MKLWLDDVRPPWKYGCLNWHWAKTYDEAVAALKTGSVEIASLDHDLSFEHYESDDESTYREKTGHHVLIFIEESGLWPKAGIRVHSMNPVGKARMLKVIERHYGRTFQW